MRVVGVTLLLMVLGLLPLGPGCNWVNTKFPRVVKLVTGRESLTTFMLKNRKNYVMEYVEKHVERKGQYIKD